jgi:tetratricopeptide (TPR) repeat protein
MSGPDTSSEALARCEEELRRCPADASAALGFHRTMVELGELERAEASLREVCRGLPFDRRLRYLLIDILLRREDNAGAMPLIEAAMADFGVDDGILDAALAVRSRLGVAPGLIPPRVSLCMIVKDEAKGLARCLHSAKPIADEIVVIDTGSRDRSADIARAFGARVHDRPWRDDFSDARNAAIASASGDWVLVLDADEVVAARDFDRLRPLIAAPPTCAYRVRTRNYTRELNTVAWRPNTGEYAREEAGAGWFPSEKVRLFPRAPGIVFRHPVHELVEPSLREAGVPILTCELQVHHYGHLEDAQRTRKTSAYAEIEKRKLEQAADRPASLREAAIQATRLGRPEEAIDLWRRFLEGHPESPEAHLNLGAACLALGRVGEALLCAETALRYAPAMREAHVNLALAALHAGDAGRAVAVLEPVLAREPAYPHARFLLAAALACGGDPAQSAATLRPMSTGPLGQLLTISFRELARSLTAAGQTDHARRMLRTASLYETAMRVPPDEAVGEARPTAAGAPSI